MNNIVLKGNICYSKSSKEICILENGYVVCENGVSAGVYDTLPERYADFAYFDFTDKIIIPGMVDLHVHAPQYTFRGLGMDMELIDWLNTHTFVEEAKYKDMEYAERAYDIFVDDMLNSGTTRACIFGTLHADATKMLMEKLEKAGLKAYVGKVNMDRNSPEYLCEESAEQSARDTEAWILDSEKFENVKPILTPRFIPTCSDELMEKLSVLQKKYKLPMQSHLSENHGEIQWVRELCPDTEHYGDAYNQFEMFGNDCPTIMAHCVHSDDSEIQMMRDQGVFVAHCPESNTNLSSGIAPVRKYLEMGVKVGLGSDIAAGSTLCIFKAMAMAIQYSKIRWRLVDQSLPALNFEEAFYLGTKGGGEFFGKVGSFEEGYEFDAVVFDDAMLKHPQELSMHNRLERLIYLADNRHICGKFVGGKHILNKNQ